MENKKMNEKQNNWVFLPVHKSRIIKELDKATLIKIDFDRTTILPKVFRRAKETDEYIFYSLPKDFNANVRVSVQNEKTRRYEHTDKLVNVTNLHDLNIPMRDYETEIEEDVGNNIEELPF